MQYVNKVECIIYANEAFLVVYISTVYNAIYNLNHKTLSIIKKHICAHSRVKGLFKA